MGNTTIDTDLGELREVAFLVSNKGFAIFLYMRKHEDDVHSFERVDMVGSTTRSRRLRDYLEFKREKRELERVYARCLITDPAAILVVPPNRS